MTLIISIVILSQKMTPALLKGAQGGISAFIWGSEFRGLNNLVLLFYDFSVH